MSAKTGAHRSPSVEQLRRAAPVELPLSLLNLDQWIWEELVTPTLTIDPKTMAQFPQTGTNPLLACGRQPRKGPNLPSNKGLTIGVLFSGGPAPGGHNVLTGIFDTLTALGEGHTLIGFKGGADGLLHGQMVTLTAEFLAPYRNQGGFDALATGRTKIEGIEALALAKKMVDSLELDGLIVIGGDDSNTNAAVMAEYFLKTKSKCVVVGVPKTIDGDLKNPFVPITFGFDTACKTYSHLIANIAKDALSTKKYYHFIKLMGRSASHITLECALQTHPNLALLGEAIEEAKLSFESICHQIADLIIARAERGKEYGVVIFPEGLFEFIPEISILIKELNQLLGQKGATIEEIRDKLSPASATCFFSMPPTIQSQLMMLRDPHGNIQLSMIETERFLIDSVNAIIEARRAKGLFQGQFQAVPHFLGYEGRCAMPSLFDSNYCYALGRIATMLVQSKKTGYMCFVKNLSQPVEHWIAGAVPLPALIHEEIRKGKATAVIKKMVVDTKSALFAFWQHSQPQWMLTDDYQAVGPLQFFGDHICSHQPPLSLNFS